MSKMAELRQTLEWSADGDETDRPLGPVFWFANVDKH